MVFVMGAMGADKLFIQAFLLAPYYVIFEISYITDPIHYPTPFHYIY